MAKEVKLYDYDTEEESLKRRQAILDSMRQSASQPLGLVQAGGMSAAPGLGSVLGKLGQQFLAQYGDKKLKEERAGLAERSREDMRKGFEGFYRTAEGYEAPSMAMAPGPDGKPATQKVPGDKRRAIFEALASGHPVLRQFAMQQLEQEGKGGITAKDLLGIAAPTSVFENPNDPSKWRGKRDIGEVGGTIYDKDKLETVQLGGARPEQRMINGDLYEVSPSTGQFKKLDNAPKISTNVSVGGPNVIMGKGQTKLSEALANAAVQDTQTANQQAQAANQALSAIHRLKEVSNSYQGPLAPAAVWMGQLADSLGIPVDKQKLANSETFSSEANQMWLSAMNAAGGARGLTEVESNRIARALPSLLQTREGREQMFKMIESRALESQAIAKKKHEALTAAGRAEDPALYFQALGEAGLGPYEAPPQVLGSPAQPSQLPGVGGAKVIKWEDLR